METKLVVEIGFSEEYNALINDIRLWLEGMNSVSMCMLVSFDEEPWYRYPVDDNMEEEEFKKLGFPDPGELRPEDFHLEGPFGPAIYEGRANEELDNEEPSDEEPNEELNIKELMWVGVRGYQEYIQLSGAYGTRQTSWRRRGGRGQQAESNRPRKRGDMRATQGQLGGASRDGPAAVEG
jgi:hypothetical protein